MNVTIPEPIRHELFNRLEESGAYHYDDDRFGLYNKAMACLTHGKLKNLTEDEMKELKYQLGVMVELGAENEGYEEYEHEAKYAAQVLRRLK